MSTRCVFEAADHCELGSIRIRKRIAMEYVLCVDNKDYPASLEVRKMYDAVEDMEAKAHEMIRVIDESGEDYLYPMKLFVPVSLPAVAK